MEFRSLRRDPEAPARPVPPRICEPCRHLPRANDSEFSRFDRRSNPIAAALAGTQRRWAASPQPGRRPRKHSDAPHALALCTRGKRQCGCTTQNAEKLPPMSEQKTLQRDIDTLLNTNRLDWLALTNEPMSSDQRIEVRKAIAARNVDLLELLQRKWILEEAEGGQ